MTTDNCQFKEMKCHKKKFKIAKWVSTNYAVSLLQVLTIIILKFYKSQ